MFEITLALLRKDKKGAINVEEFESLLKFRSIWLFKSLLPKDGVNKVFVTALSPFLVMNDNATVTANSVPISDLSGTPAHIIAISSGASLDTRIDVDIVSPGELYERLANAVTAPSATYPISVIQSDTLQVHGATGTIYVDYYTYPSEPYIDYYQDTSYNYVFFPTGTHTLLTGETSRTGVTSGDITSANVELEWRDNEKMTLINLILTDLGVSLNDQAVIQSAVFERNNTLVK
jgi:hypothetical protein